MSSISIIQPDVDRLERFQALQAGQYWRAVQDIKEEGIENGTVLLIQSIRDVDNAAHTIILRAHPEKIGKSIYIEKTGDDGKTYRNYFKYGEHRFLVDDFLSKFEYEPDHQAVRQQELMRIQRKTGELQQELIASQSDPLYLQPVIDAEMKKAVDTDGSSSLPMLPDEHQSAVMASMGSVASLMDDSLSEAKINGLKQAVQKEHQIATIKANWIQSKTAEIGETIQAMTPFFEEQAAAALAQTQDVRLFVDKLMKGIESLDLYIGKDVFVETLVKGESAAKDEPLTLVQRKLMMDEELAIWADVDEWFDFTKDEKFVESLNQNPSLVDQIFPAKRCVLVMAVTRRDVDYGDRWTNVVKNKENKKVFLLIRDGSNVHRVYSPVESHLGASKLFPSQADQDKIFENRTYAFRGIDCSQIKFQDVAYTDKLAQHELFALHYKRFLILLCGLDHRLKLLGEFYDEPQSMDFVGMDFQEKYFRFISDDDESLNLPKTERLSFAKWMLEKNGYLKSGSRVLCKWQELMNPDTAPSACKDDSYNGRRSFYRQYSPKNDADIKIAYRDGESICVDVEVTGETREMETRTFNCKVNLSKFKGSGYDYTEFPYLCLDAVTADEINWYINNRDSRRNHIEFIRLFKVALKFVKAEMLEEHDARRRLVEALEEGNVAADVKAEELVQQAVMAWRSSNRGKALPKFDGGKNAKEWKTLLDQLYALSGKQEDIADQVESFAVDLGYQPLRLVMTGNGRHVVYVAPKDEERDDRFEVHRFVHRIVLENGKRGIKEKSRRWVLLPAVSANETTLYAWSDEQAWIFKTPLFNTFEQKQKMLMPLGDFHARTAILRDPIDENVFGDIVYEWDALRKDMLERSKMVQNPYWVAPFGIYYSKIENAFFYICVGMSSFHLFLRDKAPDEHRRSVVHDYFVRVYRNKGHAEDLFRKDFRLTILHINVNAYLKTGLEFGLVESAYSVGTHDFIEETSLDARQLNWQIRNPDVPHWIPGGYTDNGRPLLDGVISGEQAKPLWVVQRYQRNRNNRHENLKFYSWYDIASSEADLPDEVDIFVKDEAVYFSSYDLAKNYISEKLKWDNKLELAKASDIADVLQPSDGIERWYFVAKNEPKND